MTELLENSPVSAGEDDVRQYLNEIRRYPRLTPEEERQLAMRCARRRNRGALSARRGLRPLRDCSALLAGQADLCRLRMPSVWGRRRKKV